MKRHGLRIESFENTTTILHAQTGGGIKGAGKSVDSVPDFPQRGKPKGIITENKRCAGSPPFLERSRVTLTNPRSRREPGRSPQKTSIPSKELLEGEYQKRKARNTHSCCATILWGSRPRKPSENPKADRPANQNISSREKKRAQR